MRKLIIYQENLLACQILTFDCHGLIPLTCTLTATTLISCIDVSPEEMDDVMQVVVFGGTSTDQANAQTPASSSSYRINLGAATLAWETESMPFPRVMGDAVLLPDGTVFVTNGGQIGEQHLQQCKLLV